MSKQTTDLIVELPEDLLRRLAKTTDSKELAREGRRMLQRGEITPEQHAKLSHAIEARQKEERKQRRKTRLAHRRRWLFLTLYGTGGHVVSLVVISLYLGIAFFTEGDLGLLAQYRLLILAWFAIAICVNRWYYRDQIREQRRLEQSIHV